MEYMDYEDLWAEFDKIAKDGRYQDALKQLDAINNQAINDKNDEQILKSWFTRIASIRNTSEDPIIDQITFVEEQLNKLTQASSYSIAYSYLGELYNEYLNQNQYKLRQLTEVERDLPEDIKEWGIEQLLDKSSELYLKSIENKSDIKVDISSYNAIVENLKEDGYKVRKTVYDVLAFRAIAYFNNVFIQRTQPIEEFVLDQEVVFSNSNDFVNYAFPSTDKNSKTYRIISLFQDMENRHPYGSETRLDVEIQRIVYAYRNTTVDNKDELYKTSLEDVLKINTDSRIPFKALQSLIQYYLNKGQSYSQDLEESNPNYVKAKELIRTYTERFNNKNEQQILNAFSTQIEYTEIRFTSELVYPINEAFPIHLSFRNSNLIQSKIFKVERDDLLEIYTQNKLENYLKKSNLISEQEFQLPSVSDYDNHTTELVYDGLPSGSYILEIKDSKKNINSIQLFHVSNIAYTNVNNQFIQVADRSSGQPLIAEIEMYSYEWSGRKRTLIKTGNGSSLMNGRFDIKQSNKSYILKLTNGNDQLFLNNNISKYRSKSSQGKRKLYTFTDRGIYRPGQRIYFKSIATIQELNNNPKVIPNEKVLVELKDANYQSVEKKELTTNEFGSIHGSFDLPKDLLNGRFTLKIRLISGNINGNKQINVEEYKRPTFEVTTNPITDSYKLDEQVILKGEAKAYTGVSISNADVKYKVIRTQPYRYYYRYYNPVPEKMIASGTIQTDENGKFKIPFIAESSKSNTNKDAVFTYAVSIDVIDISGETQSTSTSVSAGRYAKEIVASNNLIYDSNKNNFQKIKIQNLNGENQKGEVNVKISSLKTPGSWIKDKYWKNPEFQLISKEAYNSKLPNYPYQNELDKTSWETKAIFKEFKADVDSEFTNKMENIPSGYYKIELSHPEAAHVTTYIEVIDDNKALVDNLFHFTTDKLSYSTDGKIESEFISSVDQLHVCLDIVRQQEKDKRLLNLANRKFTEAFSVSKADLGGIKLLVSGIYKNRSFQKELFIKVPYTQQKLNLTWETFRSDLLPGSQEKWRLKLKDYKDQAVNAEILTSMYDASLDQFVPNKWNPFSFNGFSKYRNIQHIGFTVANSRNINNDRSDYPSLWSMKYPYLVTDLHRYDIVSVRAGGRLKKMGSRSAPMSSPMPESMEMEGDAAMDEMSSGNLKESYDDSIEPPRSAEPPIPPKASVSDIPIRKNLNETVFFLPELKTNSEGETIIEFTMNEALTEWNFQTLAHTKKAEFALDQQSVKTSKDLMVVPNGPRFFREGDKMTIPAKISNLTEKTITVNTSIKFINTLNNEDVTSTVLISDQNQKVSINASANTVAHWEIKIPSGLSSLTYQVYAKSGEHKDGEEKSAVVLPNRKLITQSQVITIPANSDHKVDVVAFDNLKTSTAEVELFQVSVTSNPSWLAIKSLPYLMEYQHKCSEQIFSRFFANQLGASIIDKNPKIQEVYNDWKDKDQLVSALKKNEDLKSAILQQTPWVMDALSEDDQMDRMATLFDLDKIQAESKSDLKTLIERQNNGGFPWFPGGKPNWFITQHILEGIGQLDKMGVISKDDPTIQKIISAGIQFIDEAFVNYYRTTHKKIEYVSPNVIHYMYTRSFYPEFEKSAPVNKAIDRFETLAQETWLMLGLMNQSQLALYFERDDKKDWSNKIIESLRQRSIQNEDLGRYWKETNGYMWHQSNIEAQATLIAAFNEIDRNTVEIDEMKMWLLNNKKTNSWKSTKATTHAVYAIVSTGSKWQNNSKWVSTKINNTVQIIPENSKEMGTGEYDLKFDSKSIIPEYRNVEFTNPNDHTAWASTSLQYFEGLDKVTSYQETPLQLKRNYFKKVITNTGDKLVKLTESSEIIPGDIITVRLSLIVDRPMEFIHLQDMRASGTEPLAVISQYKYSGGLSYYMETRDAATNFFIDYLPRGEYLFEYEQRANQPGTYSAGLSTIQSMYAPEFGANSSGFEIKINQKK